MAAVTTTAQPQTPTDRQEPAADHETSLAERMRAAVPHLRRRLPGGVAARPADVLRQLADELDRSPEPERWDRYGSSGPVEQLEQQVAGLLGKPAAAMFPSGIMAQQAALRVWTDQQGSRRVAVPELSHLLHHELDGPRLLHDLRYELLTTGPTVPTAGDLAAIPGPLGAAVLELPLREAAFQLPSWDELVAFSTACRARGVPLHFDGARLWESTPHLGHGLAAVAALADSVYVSFYKGLGGLAGAVLAGPEDVVAEAVQWRKRLGGTLYTLLPYAVSALRGLRTELPRMGDYHERARALAEKLTARGVRVHPEVPHTNAFRLYVAEPAEQVAERVVATMEGERVMLTGGWAPAELPGWSWTEFVVGPETMRWDLDDAVDALAALLQPQP
jgi:threonine aldolase